jgi:hypothetical protein
LLVEAGSRGDFGTLSDQTHTAAAFEVSLSVRGKPTQTLPLDNFNGAGSQFLRFFASYVSSLPQGRLVEDKNRSFGQPTKVTMAGCTYSCRVISGTSGIVSEFRGPDGTARFSRKGDDVEEMRFGAYFLQPPSAHVGFLIIERVGNRTIAQAFRTKLVAHFRSMYPNIILSMARTAETNAWREAEEASVTVKQITVISRGIDSGQMQDFGIGGITKKTGEYRRILKFNDEPESAGILRKVRDFFYPPMDPGIGEHGGTISIGSEPDSEADDADGDGGADEGGPDEINEVIAQVSYPGGATHSIRCSGARPPLITYPIDVGPGDDDADYASFRTGAREIVRNLAQATDCTLESGWDTGEWQDKDSLPKWEVQGFGEITAAPPQSSS